MFYIKLMHIFEKNIKSLGLKLPEVPSPVANYVPFKIVENLIHVSGQAPILDGNIKYKGKVGIDISEKDGIEAAKTTCDGAEGPVANLCYNALEVANQGPEAVEKKLEQTAGIEMASLEKNMTWISLCIATAPMLGFLGTVWGMIQAFNDIKMANDISPAVVAGGISVALLTTAFGLVVAVVLQILQNAVMYIIDNQIVTLQKSTTMLLNAIDKKAKNNF